MGKIQLKRIAMSQLLLSLQGIHSTPTEIIKQHVPFVEDEDIPEFIHRFEKKKNKKDFGLSTVEIVTLANICELTSLKSTLIQNWIKRDIKEIIGSPELGKKYSIEQAALLFIVKDLKAVFDFETIRFMLMKVFNTLSDRSDDLMSPLRFYQLYAEALENVGQITWAQSNEFPLESRIEKEVTRLLRREHYLNEDQIQEIAQILVITILSVVSSHFQLRTIRYAEGLQSCTIK